MPLEAATLIHELVPANPAATDQIGEGDDHIRMIKAALLGTFPNVDGAVTASHTQLNDVPALRTDVTALQASRVLRAGDTMTGNLTLTNADVNPTGTGRVKQGGNTLIPEGIIAMWSGSIASIPAGWALCNGQTVNGTTTPDLRDRFIVGAGSSYAVGATGGANSITPTTSSAGAHTHGAATGAGGNHDHGAATGSHVLTIAQIPAHTHTVLVSGTPFSVFGGGASGWNANVDSGIDAGSISGSTGGGSGHSHTISASGSHTHAIGSDGAHTHTVTVDTRSLYYALCFIMKV